MKNTPQVPPKKAPFSHVSTLLALDKFADRLRQRRENPTARRESAKDSRRAA